MSKVAGVWKKLKNVKIIPSFKHSFEQLQQYLNKIIEDHQPNPQIYAGNDSTNNLKGSILIPHDLPHWTLPEPTIPTKPYYIHSLGFD